MKQISIENIYVFCEKKNNALCNLVDFHKYN